MTYGSLMNVLYDNTQSHIPHAGMGATVLGWTDRYAYTICKVSKGGKRVWMRRDKAVRIDTNGMSDAQHYSYTTDTNAPLEMASLRSDGRWRMSGDDGRTVLIGIRDEHYDYSF